MFSARAPLGVTRIYRWMMTKDLKAITDFAHHLADIPDIRLITVSHGEPVLEDGRRAIQLALS